MVIFFFFIAKRTTTAPKALNVQDRQIHQSCSTGTFITLLVRLIDAWRELNCVHENNKH